MEWANDMTSGTAERAGKPSPYACPDCHGILFEEEDGNLLRFRYRVGHAYSEETLSLDLGDGAEKALWAAFRALEENALASRARARNRMQTAEQFAGKAEEYESSARIISELLLHAKHAK